MVQEPFVPVTEVIVIGWPSGSVSFAFALTIITGLAFTQSGEKVKESGLATGGLGPLLPVY